MLRKDVQSGNGYRAIQLSDMNCKKSHHYVHRLVVITFIGLPPSNNYVVNHKNLNKRDNRVENLEWVTVQENMHHAYVNGRVDFRRPMRRDNSTGTKGVSPHTGGYQVSLCGKYIGWYPNLHDARLARLEAERRMLPNA